MQSRVQSQLLLLCPSAGPQNHQVGEDLRGPRIQPSPGPKEPLGLQKAPRLQSSCALMHAALGGSGEARGVSFQLAAPFPAGHPQPAALPAAPQGGAAEAAADAARPRRQDFVLRGADRLLQPVHQELPGRPGSRPQVRCLREKPHRTRWHRARRCAPVPGDGGAPCAPSLPGSAGRTRSCSPCATAPRGSARWGCCWTSRTCRPASASRGPGVSEFRLGSWGRPCWGRGGGLGDFGGSFQLRWFCDSLALMIVHRAVGWWGWEGP